MRTDSYTLGLMNNLLVIAIAATIWFFLGVIASTLVKSAVATVSTSVNTSYNDLLIVQTIKAYGARNTFNAYVDVLSQYIKSAVAEVRKKTQSVTDAIVDAATYELADTSIYNLTVAADSAEYAAGMYLLRDNGKWSSVYLTQHARALMGDSADVVALSPARVVDAAGTSHVWHVSIA